jgi:hypothetical protein
MPRDIEAEVDKYDAIYAERREAEYQKNQEEKRARLRTAREKFEAGTAGTFACGPCRPCITSILLERDQDMTECLSRRR